LVGDKIWTLIGPLSAKDKTQLEERLRRIPGPSIGGNEIVPPQVSRIGGGILRPASPAGLSRIAGLPRAASPSLNHPKFSGVPSSPTRAVRPASPSHIPGPKAQPVPAPQSPTTSSSLARPKSGLPSRLARPRTNYLQPSSNANTAHNIPSAAAPMNGHATYSSDEVQNVPEGMVLPDGSEDITVVISTILSSDPSRSVDALKKIQKILAAGPDSGSPSVQYRQLAEHTEGLIETITLQVAHVFERPDDLLPDENFRLAKHLIQTLNTFCDHGFLAESLTVDILTSLLEELTLRLLETDENPTKKIKDLSRFINMILLRLFATGRRMSIFRYATQEARFPCSLALRRALFNLLLQIVKPFPTAGTSPDSRESKVAELVLKCIWKLVRNIPQDLTEEKLDPVELFPAIEHFLQSIPPNEWRARATNKVPCGDMPLRTIKVIIQHVVGMSYSLMRLTFNSFRCSALRG
jgi:cytoskeleton-associated protein 5